jgi:ketosteroid isomerase-like protein
MRVVSKSFRWDSRISSTHIDFRDLLRIHLTSPILLTRRSTRGSCMTAEEFIVHYEEALATQRWAAVEPLIHENCCVTISTGTVHKGKQAVRSAFERNFSTIEGEEYRISKVHWVMRTADIAVYLFGFEWTGRIDGREAAGAGKGTSVLVRNGADWQLLAEHLVAASR